MSQEETQNVDPQLHIWLKLLQEQEEHRRAVHHDWIERQDLQARYNQEAQHRNAEFETQKLRIVVDAVQAALRESREYDMQVYTLVGPEHAFELAKLKLQLQGAFIQTSLGLATSAAQAMGIELPSPEKPASD